MKLTAKEIERITFGALTTTETEEAISFNRFTEEQFSFYRTTNQAFYDKAHSTASMVIDFTTDSEKLVFSFANSYFASRTFNYVDVYENDMLICHSGNPDDSVKEGVIDLKLSKGMKRVRIYLSNLQRTQIRALELDDGAAMIPTDRKLSALVIGDSISQGFDAFYPSLHYVNRWAEEYGIEVVNQSIGGEVFKADMLGSEAAFSPDFIAIALGINDWASKSFDDIESAADAFFAKLTTLYKNTPILYISPIWIDPNGREEERVTAFEATIEMLESVASSYSAHIIHGLSLVPHDKGMYTDGVHPNDLGFTEYTKKLVAKTTPFIDLITKIKNEKEIGLTVL